MNLKIDFLVVSQSNHSASDSMRSHFILLFQLDVRFSFASFWLFILFSVVFLSYSQLLFKLHYVYDLVSVSERSKHDIEHTK